MSQSRVEDDFYLPNTFRRWDFYSSVLVGFALKEQFPVRGVEFNVGMLCWCPVGKVPENVDFPTVVFGIDVYPMGEDQKWKEG